MTHDSEIILASFLQGCHSVPPYTRRVISSTWSPCLSHADWFDVIPDSRLQGSRTSRPGYRTRPCSTSPVRQLRHFPPTISHLFLGFVLPHTRRVMRSPQCPCLPRADWCLKCDVGPGSRLHACLVPHACLVLPMTLLCTSSGHEAMVKVGAYVLGEFGHLIANDPLCVPERQLKVLQMHYPMVSVKTRCLLLSTYVNLYTAWLIDPHAMLARAPPLMASRPGLCSSHRCDTLRVQCRIFCAHPSWPPAPALTLNRAPSQVRQVRKSLPGDEGRGDHAAQPGEHNQELGERDPAAGDRVPRAAGAPGCRGDRQGARRDAAVRGQGPATSTSFWDHFSQLHIAMHTPCGVLYLLHVLIGRWLGLAIRCCARFTSSGLQHRGPAREEPGPDRAARTDKAARGQGTLSGSFPTVLALLGRFCASMSTRSAWFSLECDEHRASSC